MSTVLDYVDRLIDVLAFHGQKETGDALLTQELAKLGKGGEVCTGTQKLAKRWLLEFLTIRGSMPYLPLRGCDFVGQIRRGELHTSLDAEQAFYLSAKQVELNLQTEEDADMPDDERYSSVTLQAISLSGDQLTMRTELRSLAGTSRKVILPIDVTVYRTN